MSCPVCGPSMVMTTVCPTCGRPLDFGSSRDPRESRPVGMEQRAMRMEQRPARMEQRPARMEQRPIRTEQRPVRMEQRPGPPLSSAVLNAARAVQKDNDDGNPYE